MDCQSIQTLQTYILSHANDIPFVTGCKATKTKGCRSTSRTTGCSTTSCTTGGSTTSSATTSSTTTSGSTTSSATTTSTAAIAAATTATAITATDPNPTTSIQHPKWSTTTRNCSSCSKWTTHDGTKYSPGTLDFAINTMVMSKQDINTKRLYGR